MRLSMITAVSAAAVLAAGAAHAQADAHAGHHQPAPAAAAGQFSDADLKAFDDAAKKVKAIADGVQGGAPSAEQQQQMSAAVEASGLGVEKYNAIATAVSKDPVMRARVAVASAPASPAGSVGATATDAELAQFSAAMAKLREINKGVNGTPTAEQQQQMTSTVESSGMAVDRFNAIATALPQDARLRARVELADAHRAAGH